MTHLETLGLLLLVFIAIKYFFEIITWISLDSRDKVYRKHLDSLWEKIYSYSFYELAYLSLQRVAKRFRVRSIKTLLIPIFVFIGIYFLNYFLILISFSYSAKYSANFVFDNNSIPEIAIILFSRLGFWGSQQINWLLIGSLIFTIIAYRFSMSLLLNLKLSTTSFQLILQIAKHIIVILIGSLSSILFLYLSVKFYDAALNTEMQQYLLSQTVRMLYNYEHPLPIIILINTIASSFLTILFLSILVILAIIRTTPKFIHSSIRNLIFNITTDEKPITKQLGNIFGGISAIIAVIIKYLQ